MSIVERILDLATEALRLIRVLGPKKPAGASPPTLEDGERHRLERKLRALDKAAEPKR